MPRHVAQAECQQEAARSVLRTCLLTLETTRSRKCVSVKGGAYCYMPLLDIGESSGENDCLDPDHHEVCLTLMHALSVISALLAPV